MSARRRCPRCGLRVEVARTGESVLFKVHNNKEGKPCI